eukprot:g3743.t1
MNRRKPFSRVENSPPRQRQKSRLRNKKKVTGGAPIQSKLFRAKGKGKKKTSFSLPPPPPGTPPKNCQKRTSSSYVRKENRNDDIHTSLLNQLLAKNHEQKISSQESSSPAASDFFSAPPAHSQVPFTTSTSDRPLWIQRAVAAAVAASNSVPTVKNAPSLPSKSPEPLKINIPAPSSKPECPEIDKKEKNIGPSDTKNLVAENNGEEFEGIHIPQEILTLEEKLQNEVKRRHRLENSLHQLTAALSGRTEHQLTAYQMKQVLTGTERADLEQTIKTLQATLTAVAGQMDSMREDVEVATERRQLRLRMKNDALKAELSESRKQIVFEKVNGISQLLRLRHLCFAMGKWRVNTVFSVCENEFELKVTELSEKVAHRLRLNQEKEAALRNEIDELHKAKVNEEACAAAVTAKLSEERDILENKVEELSDSLEVKSKNVAEMTEALENVEVERKELESLARRQGTAVQDLRTQLKFQKREREKKDAEYSSRIENLELELEGTKTTASSSAREVTDLSERLEATRKKAATAIEEVADLRSSLQKATAELALKERLLTEKARSEKAMLQKLEEGKSECEVLRLALKDEAKKYEQCEARRRELQLGEANLCTQIREAREATHVEKVAKTKAEERAGAAEARLLAKAKDEQEKAAELAISRDQIARFEGELEKAKDVEMKLKEQCDHKATIIKAMREKVALANKEAIRFREEAVKLHNELCNANGRAEQAAAAVEHAHGTRARDVEEMRILRENCAQTEHQLKSRCAVLEEQVEEQRRCCEQLAEQNRAQIKNREESEARLVGKLQSRDEEVGKLYALVETEKAKVARITGDKESLQRQLDALRRRCDEQGKRLEVALQKATNETNGTEALEAQLSERARQCANLVAEIQKAEARESDARAEQAATAAAERVATTALTREKERSAELAEKLEEVEKALRERDEADVSRMLKSNDNHHASLPEVKLLRTKLEKSEKERVKIANVLLKVLDQTRNMKEEGKIGSVETTKKISLGSDERKFTNSNAFANPAIFGKPNVEKQNEIHKTYEKNISRPTLQRSETEECMAVLDELTLLTKKIDVQHKNSGKVVENVQMSKELRDAIAELDEISTQK